MDMGCRCEGMPKSVFKLLCKGIFVQRFQTRQILHVFLGCHREILLGIVNAASQTQTWFGPGLCIEATITFSFPSVVLLAWFPISKQRGTTQSTGPAKSIDILITPVGT